MKRRLRLQLPQKKNLMARNKLFKPLYVTVFVFENRATDVQFNDVTHLVTCQHIMVYPNRGMPTRHSIKSEIVLVMLPKIIMKTPQLNHHIQRTLLNRNLSTLQIISNISHIPCLL
uniref:SJCHGC02059 protein n=1 Tax=Schistosoma japonicum TaxID=6182 RepID=Q5DFG2_SCHJA|nr:SJCHGC02059 protein [Schistosoma japonicum]